MDEYGWIDMDGGIWMDGSFKVQILDLEPSFLPKILIFSNFRAKNEGPYG